MSVVEKETARRSLVEDLIDDGFFGFRVRWNYSETWADVEAWEIKSVDAGTNAPNFWEEANSSRDQTPEYERCPKYLSGFVKWDGCMELDQGKPHWCGPRGLKAHAALLEYIYRRAMVLMDATEEPWEPTPIQMKLRAVT